MNTRISTPGLGPILIALNLATLLVLLWMARSETVQPHGGEQISALEGRIVSIEESVDAILGVVTTGAPEGFEEETSLLAAPEEPSRTQALPPAGDEEVTALLVELKEALAGVEGLLLSVKENTREMSATFPSRELLDRAPQEQGWGELQLVIEGFEAGGVARDNSIDRLRWLSQEDVLSLFGRPNFISDDGSWHYKRAEPVPGTKNNVQLYFALDYLMRVRVY